MSDLNNAYHAKSVGIIGGGQLGRMLIQADIDLNVSFAVLDPDPEAPCSQIAAFQVGPLSDYDTILEFGRKCDVITIEIEQVNVAALKQLVKEGKQVFPQPEIIELIQNKRHQKQFYHREHIPTAEFILTDSQGDVANHVDFLPAVHKLAVGGYDGRGVSVIKHSGQLDKAFDAPGVLEKWIDFKHEIAVQVARNASGEIAVYPVVEMVFHPEANLVEYLYAPANIADDLAEKAQNIATQTIKSLKMVGILAVEMFVTHSNEIIVNEVAPRPHNSGHHTIESNDTSQYHQHLRAILNLPLGNTSLKSPAAMVNLLGEMDAQGSSQYLGLSEALKIPGVYVHLYGKKTTKPFRKMGHVTILEEDISILKRRAETIKQLIKVTA